MPELVTFEFVPKEFFFDRKTVIDAYEKGRRQALSKIGAFIMTGARSLTNKLSKGRAQPGMAPRRHAGQLHDMIYFAGDAAYETVVIGSVTFDKKDDVPGLLELGGDVSRREYRNRLAGQLKTFHYHKFPYMAPSLQEAINNNKLSEAWKDAVRP